MKLIPKIVMNICEHFIKKEEKRAKTILFQEFVTQLDNYESLITANKDPAFQMVSPDWTVEDLFVSVEQQIRTANESIRDRFPEAAFSAEELDQIINSDTPRVNASNLIEEKKMNLLNSLEKDAQKFLKNKIPEA